MTSKRIQRYVPPIVSVGATLGWMAITMIFLGTSDPPIPDPARELKGWWVPVLAHLFLFGVLGFLVSFSTTIVGRSKKLRTNMMVVVLVGSLWGLFTEILQTTVPGRSAEVDDFLANVVGSVVGGLSAWTVSPFLNIRAS